MMAAVHFSDCGSSGVLATRVQRLTETNSHSFVHQHAGGKIAPAIPLGTFGVLLAAAAWCASDATVLLLVHHALERLVALLA